ncbi:hypothetical protein LSCM1_05531 [Leishmania martiniquensis]|uniref:Uncharacterized protein n=1 Tax=Leishmania martiniquensis TaxID=1580590 RepID=A0A836HRX3_9TRYP|nr:hypothetical protein LSCM1_05531 [Leishmania martiniquensis]
MGCAGSKKKVPRPPEGQAAETGTPQSVVPYEAEERLDFADFSVRSWRLCLEEAPDSDSNTLPAQRYGRRLTHSVQESSIAEVSSLPPHLVYATSSADGGTPRALPAASFFGLVSPATSAPPQSTQLTPSREGPAADWDARKTPSTYKPRGCDKASQLQFSPGDMLPTDAPLSAIATVHLDLLPRSLLPSRGAVVGTPDSADALSETLLHSARNNHEVVPKELRQDINSTEGGPLLAEGLCGAGTTGASILPTIRSMKPPSPLSSLSSSCRSGTLPAARQPSTVLLSVPPPESATVVETAAAPTEPPRARQLPSARTAEARHCLQLESTEGFYGGVALGTHQHLFSFTQRAEGVVVDASVPMNTQAGTPVRWCFECHGGAAALCSGGVNDGRWVSTSDGSLSARSTQPLPAVSSTDQLSVSAFSLRSTPRKQQQLSVTQTLSLGLPEDSASPTQRIPAQQPTPPRRPAPATTGPANFSVPACSDAPDDVLLPQRSDVLSLIPASSTAGIGNAGGGRTGGVRTPPLPMYSAARQRSFAMQEYSESLLTAPSVAVTTGAAATTQPRTSRWECGSSKAHSLAAGGSSWRSSSMNSADCDSGGFAGGTRWHDAGLSTTLLPTNVELVRQIRQPTTHVKSILRKTGGFKAIANSEAAVNDDGAAGVNNSRVRSLSANGGCRVAGNAETTANSSYRILAGSSSSSAVGGDRWVSVTSSSMTEAAPQTDFIVLRSSTSEVDCANRRATPEDASPLPLGGRSATYDGSLRGAWSQPKLLKNESATSRKASDILRVGADSGSDFVADAVASASADGASPGAAADRSYEFPRRLPQSPFVSRRISPHAAQQRHSSDIGRSESANFGNPSNGEMEALLSQSTEVGPSTSIMPDTVATACRTSDEPPPDIMLAAPSPKRVHVVV